MIKKIVSLFLLALLAATSAGAQEAPAPRKMPRTPVTRKVLEPGSHDPVPASHEIQGSAIVLDGEKIRIGRTDLRLFGVVPPQLSASFGPQARAYLDNLINGLTISCKVRDRDRDGRLLATCKTPAGTDLALTLLKRGLAVAARGSIIGTELAEAYVSAEQVSQSQKIGIWSLSASSEAQTQEQPKEAATSIASRVAAVAAPLVASALQTDHEQTKADDAAKGDDSQLQAKVAEDILSQHADIDAEEWAQSSPSKAGFFERYQLLISALLMLATALSISYALRIQKARDRREELRALAAALRGELMAARSICLSRAKNITNEDEDLAASWPRIRSTLYQAHVGRLGMLGADLSRQIASIYGQSNDYAALYNHSIATGAPFEASKKHALEMLLKHIEDVLPKLAEIERTGTIRHRPVIAPPPSPVPPMPRRRRTDTSPNRAAMAIASSELSAPASPPAHAVASAHIHPMTALLALASSLGSLLRSLIPQKEPMPEPLPPLPQQFEAQVADYTALIEADMEQYQSLDVSDFHESIASRKRRG